MVVQLLRSRLVLLIAVGVLSAVTAIIVTVWLTGGRDTDDEAAPTVATTTPGGGRVLTPAAGGPGEFVDEQRGYRFTVPKNWTVVDPVPPAAAVSGFGVTDAVAAREGAEGSGTGFIAARLEVEGDLGDDAAFRRTIGARVRELAPGGPAPQPTVRRVGDLDGVAFSVTVRPENQRPSRSLLVYLRRAGTVYQLSCQAPPAEYEAFLRRCEPVIDSFRPTA